MQQLDEVARKLWSGIRVNLLNSGPHTGVDHDKIVAEITAALAAMQDECDEKLKWAKFYEERARKAAARPCIKCGYEPAKVTVQQSD